MPFCPKCEQEFREGFEVCADCGIDLVATLTTPESVAEKEEEFAQELFENPERDLAHACQNCLNEFAQPGGQCAPCGGPPVVSMPRDSYEKTLVTSVLDGFARFRVPEAADGLERITVASDPAGAGFIVESLHSMGVDAEVGNDALDRDIEDSSRIGIYCPLEQVDAARLLLEDDDGLDDEDDTPGDDYATLLRSAQAYSEILKYRHAIDLCARAIDQRPDRPEALMVLGHVLGSMGSTTRAAEAFETAMPSDPSGEAHFYFAAFALLTENGEPDFGGPRSSAACEALSEYCRRQPRSVQALKLLFEATCETRSVELARETAKRIQELNRSVFAGEGRMAELLQTVGA